MRPLAASLVVLTLLAPTGAAAQSRLAQPARAAARFERPDLRPVVSVAPVAIAGEDEDSMIAIQRAGERIADRLRPLQQRLQGDDRLRRTGAVVGLGAVAIGALRGTAPLTFAGTQAIRF